MTKLFCFDDSGRQHKHFARLVRELKADRSEYRVGNHKVCKENSTDAWAAKCGRDSTETNAIWNALAVDADDALYLVDFKLGKDEQIAKLQLEPRLVQMSAGDANSWAAKALQNLATWKAERHPVLEFYTAFFICAVAIARGQKCVLISSGAHYEAKVFATQYRIPFAPGNAISPDWADWRDKILQLGRHPDRIIAPMLTAYSRPIDGTYGDIAWTHNECGEALQLSAGKEVFGFATEPDVRTNKAFHCRNEDEWRYEEQGSHPVSKRFLRNALKRIELLNTSKLRLPGGKFQFPLEPGLAFLLSLRELVTAMEDGNKPGPVGLVWEADKAGDVYSLTLHLDPKHAKGPKHLKKVLRERRASGFRGAVRHLAHCRLSRIRCGRKEKWAKMFKTGARKPLMSWSVVENENAIRFQWSVSNERN